MEKLQPIPKSQYPEWLKRKLRSATNYKLFKCTSSNENPKIGDVLIDNGSSESPNSRYHYIYNGKSWVFHREDGPAIELRDHNEYWLNGWWYYTKQEWQEALEVLNAKQITDLF